MHVIDLHRQMGFYSAHHTVFTLHNAIFYADQGTKTENTDARRMKLNMHEHEYGGAPRRGHLVNSALYHCCTCMLAASSEF